jgi:hypothetical protein
MGFALATCLSNMVDTFRPGARFPQAPSAAVLLNVLMTLEMSALWLEALQPPSLDR